MRSPSDVLTSWPTRIVTPIPSRATNVARLERAVDRVVVGDREVRQAARRGGTDDGLGRRERVERGRGVDVQVEEGPDARSGSRTSDGRDQDFLKKSKCSSARPVPSATQFSGFSATWHGTPVTWVSSLSMFRSSDAAARHDHALVDDVAS